MKPQLFFRVASVLTLIHALLHTIGGVFGKTAPGPASVAVAAMKANVFMLMGNPRSYFEFYRGLGLGVSIALTAEGIVFWQLATLAKTDAVRLRPIAATFLLAYLGLAVNSFLYFFWPPVITEIVIVVCLAAAIATAKPAQVKVSTSYAATLHRDRYAPES